MGYTTQEITNARANVPEQFAADPGVHLFGPFAKAGGGDEPATEQERRNEAAREVMQEQDDALIAKGAGVITNRTDLADAGNIKERRAQEGERRRKEANSEARYLAALQDQIADLEADIAALDDEMDDILIPYLSDAEQEYLDDIDDPARKANEKMRFAREKFENGEMPQSEFDAFESRWEERQAKQAKFERAVEKRAEIENLDDAAEFTEEFGTSTALKAGYEADADQRKNIDIASGQQEAEGIASVEEDLGAALGDLGGGSSLFGGEPTTLDAHKGMAKEEFSAAAAGQDISPAPEPKEQSPALPSSSPGMN